MVTDPMTRFVLGLLMLLTPLAVLFVANYDPTAGDITDRQRPALHSLASTNPAAHRPAACGDAPLPHQASASAAQVPILLLELLIVSTAVIADTLGPLTGRYAVASEAEPSCGAGW
jgi:hypothetical protein